MPGLTNNTVKNLKPTGKDYRVRDKAGKDSGYHGFGIKVTRAGAKSFFLEYTMNGRRRFIHLGHYPAISLSDARKDAKNARSLVDKGIDPQLERKRTEEAEAKEEQQRIAELNATTLNQLLDYYIGVQSNQGTVENIKTLLGRDAGDIKRSKSPGSQIRKRFGTLKLKDIDSKTIKRILKVYHDRGSAISERQTHTYLTAAFNRLLKDDGCPGHDEIDTNPLLRITKPEKGSPDRTALTTDGILDFWTTLDTYTRLTEPLKDALRLLLLTGQRVQEVLGMRWSELSLEEKLWTIPPARLKTGKKRPDPHMVPLPDLAIEIIKRQTRLVDDSGKESDCIFPGRDNVHEPYKWRSLGQGVARMISAEDLPYFTPRTLRGTVKTHMARIKIMKEVRDRIQNHALHDVADVHYDAYDYLDEKRQGLRRWEKELRRIVDNSEDHSNVVELRSAQ